MDFSNRLIIERGKRARPRVVFRTKFKAQRNEFEFERRNGTVECSFRRKPQTAAGNGTDAEFDEDQANKSARGMPWHQEPMKDVISCDKLRGAANEH